MFHDTSTLTVLAALPTLSGFPPAITLLRLVATPALRAAQMPQRVAQAGWPCQPCLPSRGPELRDVTTTQGVVWSRLAPPATTPLLRPHLPPCLPILLPTPLPWQSILSRVNSGGIRTPTTVMTILQKTAKILQNPPPYLIGLWNRSANSALKLWLFWVLPSTSKACSFFLVTGSH